MPTVLFVACGAVFTFKGKFFQLRRFGESLTLAKNMIKSSKKNKGKGITSFQSASTALSATVGTGNIAGVAGAISLGGPGAVFWMWVTSFLGMAIKFCEIELAVKHRIKTDGGYIGGPMLYIKSNSKNSMKILSVLFSLALIVTSFCTGNITQANAVSSLFCDKKAIQIFLGAVLSILTFTVLCGGNKRIGLVSEKVTPIMSLLYIMLCLVIILINYRKIPYVISKIFIGAFSPESVTSGAISGIIPVIFSGSSRGIFSHEAGLGTSAMAHSEAVDADLSKEGLFGVFEVFADTGIICTLTALTILTSGVKIEYGKLSSTLLVNSAFESRFGGLSFVLLSLMMILFAFSSIIGWASFGNSAVKFMMGEKGKKWYLAVYSLLPMVGALCNVSFAFSSALLFNGIILIINLFSLLLLREEIIFD